MVSSGSGAIIDLQGTFYDLVITNMTMEGINGLDVLKAAINIAPLIPVIVITGYDRDSNLAIEAMSI